MPGFQWQLLRWPCGHGGCRCTDALYTLFPSQGTLLQLLRSNPVARLNRQPFQDNCVGVQAMPVRQPVADGCSSTEAWRLTSRQASLIMLQVPLPQPPWPIDQSTASRYLKPRLGPHPHALFLFPPYPHPPQPVLSMYFKLILCPKPRRLFKESNQHSHQGSLF